LLEGSKLWGKRNSYYGVDWRMFIFKQKIMKEGILKNRGEEHKKGEMGVINNHQW